MLIKTIMIVLLLCGSTITATCSSNSQINNLICYEEDDELFTTSVSCKDLETLDVPTLIAHYLTLLNESEQTNNTIQKPQTRRAQPRYFSRKSREFNQFFFKPKRLF